MREVGITFMIWADSVFFFFFSPFLPFSLRTPTTVGELTAWAGFDKGADGGSDLSLFFSFFSLTPPSSGVRRSLR